MFRSIKFKFGSSLGSQSLEIEPTSLTVFVGPNNSGKSKVLKEISNFCSSGYLSENLIIKSIVLSSIENIDEIIKEHKLEPLPNETVNTELEIIFGKRGVRNRLNIETLKTLLQDPNVNTHQFFNTFFVHNVSFLDGSNRLQMVNPQPMGDLSKPENPLAILFTNDSKRKNVKRIVYDAFQKYFVLDPTLNGQFSIKLSQTKPSAELEKSLTAQAIKYHQGNLPIGSTSDGVKAYLGIVIALIADNPKIILIDEPEAFLHPSLSFKLGKEIGSILKNDSFKKVFVSTHSANFLMGCIQSGASLDIVRLTYSNDVPTARHLQSEKVYKLMRHPLLRSVNALNGLFYEYVIVTESDSDRAFYQEINERLLAFEPEKGITNCLFLNAQNKQTVHEIMKPLREMGIPCASIVDIDVIKEGGQNWTNLIGGAFFPDLTKKETETSRSNIWNKFKEIDMKQEAENKIKDFSKRNGGVNVLDKSDKEGCHNLFNRLEEYGIFVVRNGELESWLKHLGVTNKYKWLIDIFEKMGDDPISPEYVKPTDDDVWNFIADIKKWLTNPNRKGIPE